MALEALRGDKTIQDIAVQQQVHPNRVSTWKPRAVEGMADLFARGGKPEGPTYAAVKKLHAKIGRLAVENDFFITRVDAVSPERKCVIIKRDHSELSIGQQCKLVRLSWSACYYTPNSIASDRPAKMKETDRVFSRYLVFSSCQIAACLRREGFVVGRHRVRRLMAEMGLVAISKCPRSRRPHPQCLVFPYSLRGMQIDCPSKV